MIEYVQTKLRTRGSVWSVSYQSQGTWFQGNMIAVDAVGIAVVDHNNETAVVPWSALEKLNLGDVTL